MSAGSGVEELDGNFGPYVTGDGRQFDSVTTGMSAAGTMSSESRAQALAVLKAHVPADETRALSDEEHQNLVRRLLRAHFSHR